MSLGAMHIREAFGSLMRAFGDVFPSVSRAVGREGYNGVIRKLTPSERTYFLSVSTKGLAFSLNFS